MFGKVIVDSLWTRIIAGILLFNLIGGGWLVISAIAHFHNQSNPEQQQAFDEAPRGKEQSRLPYQKFLQIGAGAPSETIFAVASGIAAGVSRPLGTSPCDESQICGVPGLIAVAQSSNGALEDINNMRLGLIDSAIITTDIAYSAYRAAGPFRHRPAFEDFSVLARLTPVVLHIAVRADSDIQTLGDFAGKTIAMGSENSAQLRLGRLLLQTVGLGRGEYKELNLSSDAAIDALTDKTIDGLIELGTVPISSLSRLSQFVPIRLLTIDNVTMQSFQSLYPFVNFRKVPIYSYEGQQMDVRAVNLDVVWIVNKTVSPAMGYEIVKALWQGQAEKLYQQINPHYELPQPELIQSIRILPIHEGAKRYYQEQGILP